MVHAASGACGTARAGDGERIARAFAALRQRHGLANIPAAAIVRLEARLPRLVVEDHAELLAVLAEQVSATGAQPPRSVPPTTASWAAGVHLIVDASGPRAVVKIDARPGALVREAGALTLLRSARRVGVHVPEVLHLGRASTPQGWVTFLVTTAAGPRDLRDLLVGAAGHDAERWLHQAGCMTAALHRWRPAGDDVAAIEAERRAHLGHVGDLMKALDALVGRGWLTVAVAAALRPRIQASMDAYARTPGCDLTLGVAHGDCYAANFVPWGHGMQMVDVETTLWSLGREGRGIADVRQDLGRFCQALVLDGIRNGTPPAQVRQQQRAFWRGVEGNSEPHSSERLRQHAEFFRLRYDAVVVRASLHGQTRKASEAEARLYVATMAERLLANHGEGPNATLSGPSEAPRVEPQRHSALKDQGVSSAGDAWADHL